MKNSNIELIQCKRLNVLIALVIFLGCTKGTEPDQREKTQINLYWKSTYDCRNGSLFGIYQGTLHVDGLVKGEKIKIYYGDSLVSDTIADKDDLILSNLETSDVRILPVSIVYRSDSLRLSSEERLLDTQTPFPVRFELIATKPATADGVKRFSLLASDYGFDRIRCKDSDGILGFTIQTDTLKYNATAIHVIMWADTYAGIYHLWADYQDTANTTKSIYKYDVIFNSTYNHILPKVNTDFDGDFPVFALKRGSFGFSSAVPTLPAQVTVSLGLVHYSIRVEKE